MITSIVITCIYCLSCYGWACIFKINPALKLVLSESHLGMHISKFLIGMFVVFCLLTFVGLIGALKLKVLAVIVLFGLLGWMLNREQFKIIKINELISQFNREHKLIQLLFFSLTLIVFTYGLASLYYPPLGDAEAYYFAYPKVIAATGYLGKMPGPYQNFSILSVFAELHFATLILLSGTSAAKLFVWVTALCAGGLLSEIVKITGGGRVARLLSWVILFSSSTFTNYIYDGKVDLFALSLGLATIYWAMLESTYLDKVRFFLTGLFFGLACMAKFSYIPALGTTLIFLFLLNQSANFKRQRLVISLKALSTRKYILNTFSLLLGFLLAWAPHILKNQILFSAPLGPFYGYHTDWLNQTWHSSDTTLKIIFTYPFALTLGNYQMQGGNLSFLLLAFLPFVFDKRFLDFKHSFKPAVILAISGIAGVVIWTMFRPSVFAPRYFLASLMLITIVVSIATEKKILSIKTDRITFCSVLISCFIALVINAVSLRNLPKSIISSWTEKDECSLATIYCNEISPLRNLPDGERVFMACFYTYWFRADQLVSRDTPQESQEILIQGNGVISWLKLHGFHYLVVDKSSVSHQNIARMMEQALKMHTKEIRVLYDLEVIKVYQLI